MVPTGNRMEDRVELEAEILPHAEQKGGGARHGRVKPRLDRGRGRLPPRVPCQGSGPSASHPPGLDRWPPRRELRPGRAKKSHVLSALPQRECRYGIRYGVHRTGRLCRCKGWKTPGAIRDRTGASDRSWLLYVRASELFSFTNSWEFYSSFFLVRLHGGDMYEEKKQ
jgi:hypothetical protein